MSHSRGEPATVAPPPGPELPDLEPVQLLDPDGVRLHHPCYDIGVTVDDLVDLHRAMVLTRLVDRELVNLQRQGELALFAPSEGQEAASIGLVRGVPPTDWIFVQYRELGVMLERGVPVGRIGEYWRGNWHSAWTPNDHRLGAITIPIATNSLHAVGYAMGVRIDGGDEVVVTCIGDGGTSEGDAHEAMNFASVFEAPVVFFVQNNQWAISTPVHEQHRAASFAHKALAYGMTGVRCDGNDVLATIAVVRHHVAEVRAGAPPVLIEAVTHRQGPHTTSDDPTLYRSSDETADWARRDPIDRIERHLARLDEWSDERAEAARAAAAATTAELRRAVLDADDPDPLELFDHVFAEPTVGLRRQAQELAAELEAAEEPSP